MAKKKNGLLKAAVGVGAAVVAGKVAFDKYKETKSKFTKEEQESAELEVRKYNAICEKKTVEVEDEEFMGCEFKSIASKAVIDLALAVFEKDVYINFESVCSKVTIILPEGVNATCDIERKLAGVHNLVKNTDEEGIHTVYIIGKASFSNVDIIPVDFYVENENDYEDESDFDDNDVFNDTEEVQVKVINKTEETKDESEEEKAKTEESASSEEAEEKEIEVEETEPKEEVSKEVSDEEKEDAALKEPAQEEFSKEETDKTEVAETINLEEV